MANAAAHHDHHGDHHDQEEMKQMGLWMFLITDIVLFGSIFASFMVLRLNTDGDVTGAELFKLPGIIAETFILLTSSYTSGLAILSMNKGNKKGLMGWLAVTALLGAAFLYLEIAEFVHLAHEGATIATSAFWSAFYTLVGTHGLHVTLGFFWMVSIIIQINKRGINPVTKRKVSNVSMYWHFLDIVWIFVFTLVYLMEVM